MIPPERTAYKRDVNVQSTGPPTTIQKIMRFAEKDDLLLYITAAFGILMPAVMYFFYRTVHSKYRQYQSQKRKSAKVNERVARAKEPRTISLFYAPTETAKKIAYNLAEQLESFDPIVRKLVASEIASSNLSTKSVLIFIVEELSKESSINNFLDWLDELRYEYRQRSYMRGSSFLVLNAADSSCSEQEGSGRNSQNETDLCAVLHKRLEGLQGRPISAPKPVNLNEEKQCMKDLVDELSEFLRQFQFGAFDEFEKGSSQSNSDESESSLDSN